MGNVYDDRDEEGDDPDFDSDPDPDSDSDPSSPPVHSPYNVVVALRQGTRPPVTAENATLMQVTLAHDGL